MAIDIFDENNSTAGLELYNATRKSSPHEEVVLSYSRIIDWHKKENIKSIFEARNFIRAIYETVLEKQATGKGLKFNLEEEIRTPLELEYNLETRYRITSWLSKTINSWLVVFEATGEDAYELTRSSYFNQESDIGRLLDRRTRSDKKWSYTKSVRERGFVKFKRSKFPGYSIIEEMLNIIECIRRETSLLKGRVLPTDQTRVLCSLIGLYFPIRKTDELQRRRWKNYNTEDIISLINEHFKITTGVDVTEKLIENEVKKYIKTRI